MANTESKRVRIDRDVVLATAAELVNRRGLASLSMSGLASALGVKTPSLYAHVAGIEQVKRMLALRGLAEMESDLTHSALGKTPADAVRALLHSYLAFVRHNPGVYEAMIPSPPSDDAEWTAAAEKIQVANQAVLAGFGFRADEEIHVQRGMRSLAHGFAAFEASGAFKSPVDRDESFDWLVEVFLSGLQPKIAARTGAAVSKGSSQRGTRTTSAARRKAGRA